MKVWSGRPCESNALALNPFQTICTRGRDVLAKPAAYSVSLSPVSKVRFRYIGWVYPLAMVLMIFIASGQSHVAGPNVVGFDKVAHFFAFGSVATAIVRVLPRRYGLWVILLVSLYGVSDEWRQSFTAGRSVEVADWVADTCGAAVAVTAYLYWPAYRRILEFPLGFRRRKRRIEKPAEAVPDSPS